MNGRSIRSAGDLRNRLGLTPVGEQVELRVQRGGATRLLRTQIARRRRWPAATVRP